MDVRAAGGVRLATITALPSGGRTGQLVVAQDQTLDGQVIDVEGNNIIVSIGNQQVSARADSALRPGDNLRLVVRETGPDRVVLQIVGRGGTLEALRSFDSGALAAELTRIGVNPDEQSIAVARELMGRGLPLTSANVLDVRGGLARLGLYGAADVRAAVFLKAQGLPISAEALQIVRQAFASSTALGQQVGELRDSLADVARQLLSQGGAQPGSSGENVDSLAARLSNFARTMAGLSAGGSGQASAAASAGLADSAAPAAIGAGARASAAGESVASGAGGSPGANGGGAEPLGTPAAGAFVRVGMAEGRAGSTTTTPSTAPSSGTTTAPSEAASSAATAAASPGATSVVGPSTGSAAAANDEPANSVPAPTAASVVDVSGRAVQRTADAVAVANAAVTAIVPPTTLEASDASGGLARLAALVANALGALPMLDDQAVAAGRTVLAEQVRQVVSEQGTPLEAKLARVLAGLGHGAGVGATIAGDLRATLLALTEEVAQQAAAQNLPAETMRALHAARANAETLVGSVDVQQLTNAAPGPAGQQQVLVFQLPIPGGRDGQMAEIRIRQDADGSGKRIDPKNMHVLFQFELENLRTVRISLQMADKRLSCQIGSSDPTATALLRQHAEELRDGLSGLGYAVDTLRCAVLTPEELAPPAEAPSTPSSVPQRVLRIDARA